MARNDGSSFNRSPMFVTARCSMRSALTTLTGVGAENPLVVWMREPVIVTSSTGPEEEDGDS